MCEEAERLRASCRVCLRNRGVLNIFLSHSALAKLRACAPIQIFEDDGLPDSLCTMCAISLDQAYCFRVQCEESDRRLSALRDGGCDAPVRPASPLPHVKRELEPESAAPGQHFEVLLIKKEETDIALQPDAEDSSPYLEMPVSTSLNDTECDTYDSSGGGGNAEAEVAWTGEAHGCGAGGAEARAQLECGLCPLKLRSGAEARAHARLHKEEQYECEVCGKVCKGARRIQIHKNTHLNVERTCEVCGVVVHKYRLKSHIADKHAPQPKQCPICSVVLSSRSALTNHLQRHIDMGLECDLCGKKYRNKISMRTHIKTHSDKKMFPCSLCDKRFSSDKYKVAHERTHGAARFLCSQCGRGFAQRAQLVTHCTNKHPHLLDNQLHNYLHCLT